MSTSEFRLRTLRGAVCEYLDDGLIDEFISNLKQIFIQEQEYFASKTKIYADVVDRMSIEFTKQDCIEDEGYESGAMFTGHPLRPASPPSHFDPRLIALATSSEQIPPGPYSEDELRKQWNNQADEFNQWESLDLSEQLAWAQVRAIAADRNRRPAAPPAPLEGEVGELVIRLRRASDGASAMGWEQDSWTIARAADLLEQRQAAPVPVAMSERLPQAEDCDAEGRCWRFYPENDSQWDTWRFSRSNGQETHWLPCSSLPLPAPQGGEVEV